MSVGRLSIRRIERTRTKWDICVHTSDNSSMYLDADTLEEALQIANVYVQAGKDVVLEETFNN